MKIKERQALEKRVRDYWHEVGHGVVRMVGIMRELGVNEVGGIKFDIGESKQVEQSRPVTRKKKSKKKSV